MTAALPPSFQLSYSYLLDRLQTLHCPLLPQLRGESSSEILPLNLLIVTQSQHESLFKTEGASSANPLSLSHLSTSDPASDLTTSLFELRLSLLGWLIEAYDGGDLLRVFADVAEEYTLQRNKQHLLAQFQRLLRIYTFLGLVPSGHPAPLTLMTGAASVPLQLQMLHAMIDLIHSVPKDPFYASHKMYSSVHSFMPHNDPEFHKHIRLLHCISHNVSHPEPGPHSNSVFQDTVELFPATLMVSANSFRQIKDKKEGNTAKRNLPDVASWVSQLDRLQKEYELKSRVLSDLQTHIPLTNHEEYEPHLQQLEYKLQTFVQMALQFSLEFNAKFKPLITPILERPITKPLEVFPSQLLQLMSQKSQLDQVLNACVAMKKHYGAMARRELRTRMEELSARKPDDKTTLKLAELRKTFEASLLRIEKQSQRREQDMNALKFEMEMNAAAQAAKKESSYLSNRSSTIADQPMVAQTPMSALHVQAYPSPSPMRHSSLHSSASTPAAQQQQPPYGASSTATMNQSILTSSVDLTTSHENVGSGSAGLFSPLKPFIQPAVPRTRTGAVDQPMLDRRRAEMGVSSMQASPAASANHNSLSLHQQSQQQSLAELAAREASYAAQLARMTHTTQAQQDAIEAAAMRKAEAELAKSPPAVVRGFAYGHKQTVNEIIPPFTPHTQQPKYQY